MDQQEVRVDYFRYIQQPFAQHTDYLCDSPQFPRRYYRKRGFKYFPQATPATKGGMTKAYVKINGTIFQAIAKCHPRLDAFSYRIGRAIATGRLRKLLKVCVAQGELSSGQVENVIWK